MAKSDVLKDLKEVFPAEFVNRLDGIVVFQPLDRESIKKIVKLHIQELEERLEERNIKLSCNGSLMNTLAKLSYHPESGAREVRRVIADKLEMPLVEELLTGELKSGTTLRVTFDKKKELCTFEKERKKVKSEK